MMSKLRKGLCVAALGWLLAAASASAHTIDVGRAEAAVRAVAEAVGEVHDTARCWRGGPAPPHARHLAVCAVWWVRTAAGESCTLFYEVRLARHPSRRLLVTQTFDPWCG
jgi:hypothetical protein